MAKQQIGYIATWGKNAQKNDLEYISDVVLYFRHIGLEHGEWNLVTCLFAHQSKGSIPVRMEHMTSYFNCTDKNVKKWLASLRDHGHVIMSKRKANGEFIYTMDCSPILEKVAAFIKVIDKKEKENNKLSFPAFAKVQQIVMEEVAI